ncbi:MAG TPA: hypothetical protein VNU93_08135 [Verrucomicrobiae bacterium]|nr:hypothetical protein [Verrucomicrobiae bacterium]
MKSASIAELKTELKRVPQAELIETVLRLARYKKENKELLSYLLFEADDLPGYIQSVQKEIEDGFADVNTANMHYAKKGIRKVLRITNKHIRYTGSKVAEVELLLHFCRELQELDIRLDKSTQLTNLYLAQLKKIRAAIATMHEDLQYDYLGQLEELE